PFRLPVHRPRLSSAADRFRSSGTGSPGRRHGKSPPLSPRGDPAPQFGTPENLAEKSRGPSAPNAVLGTKHGPWASAPYAGSGGMLIPKLRRFRAGGVARNPWQGAPRAQWPAAISPLGVWNVAGRPAMRFEPISKSSGVQRSCAELRATSA